MTALRSTSHPALRSVVCRISERRAVLIGQVPSFYLKQVAQSLILGRLRHSLELENQLQVSRPVETTVLQ